MAGSTAGAIATTSPSNVRSGQASDDDRRRAGPTRTRPRWSAATWAATSTRSTFATSRSGWAAVPSTCSPTPTKRFTTWPEIGDVDVGARELPVGGGEGGLGLLERRPRPRRAWARASSTSLPAAIPRSKSRSVRARLSRAFSSAAFAWASAARACRCWSSSGRRLDLRHHLPRPDAVALGHAHRDHPAGHLRGELHVLVRRRGDRAAHEERLDQVAPRDRAGLGRDRRHLGRDDLLVAPRAGAGGQRRAPTPGRRRGGRDGMRLYSIGPPSTSSRSASAD